MVPELETVDGIDARDEERGVGVFARIRPEHDSAGSRASFRHDRPVANLKKYGRREAEDGADERAGQFTVAHIEGRGLCGNRGAGAGDPFADGFARDLD